MNNIKISIFFTMIIATSLSGSDVMLAMATTRLMSHAIDHAVNNILPNPIVEGAKSKAIHEHNGRVEDARIQTMENEFKQCLINNMRSPYYSKFFKIPAMCVEQARIFMIEAGHERADLIIANFKKATQDIKISKEEMDAQQSYEDHRLLRAVNQFQQCRKALMPSISFMVSPISMNINLMGCDKEAKELCGAFFLKYGKNYTDKKE